jgi:hypothetical protein
VEIALLHQRAGHQFKVEEVDLAAAEQTFKESIQAAQMEL